jgi:CheY-like chemotaxis protein
MQGLLEMAGARVTLAHSGKDCLARLAESIPTLVLLDIQMPRMSGVEVLRAIRKQDATRELPVIAITATSQASGPEKLLAEGFTGYIGKPFTDLVPHIRAILKTLPQFGASA